MVKKENRQYRLVLGLEDESDLYFLLDILYERHFWAPFHVTKTQLKKDYKIDIPFPKNVVFDKILLISSFSQDNLKDFAQYITHSTELNAYVSSIF